jgi:chemotaxis-related protein WspD
MPAELDACWSKIGVRGDGSCPELRHHVHCRNCPVHAAAALKLLDRPPPSGYIEEWTEHIARITGSRDGSASTASTRDGASALVFQLGHEFLALPTSVVKEVAELRVIHRLPQRRDGPVLGIANIRGELLVCVSLGRLLDVDETPQAPRGPAGRLLVIGRDDRRTVLPVGAVHGIHRYRVRDLARTPATIAKAASPYTEAMLSWQDRTVACLDADRLLAAVDRCIA